MTRRLLSFRTLRGRQRTFLHAASVVLLTTAACSPGPVPRRPVQAPAKPTPAPAVTAAEPSGAAAAEAAWLELTRSSSATTFPAIQSARVRCQPDGMLISGYASFDKSPIDIDPTSAVRLESGADFVGWLGVDGTRWFETAARPASLSVAAFAPDGSMVLRRTDRTDRPSRSTFSLRELDGHERLLRDGTWTSADVAFAPDGDIFMASSPMYRQKAKHVEELSPSLTRLDRTGRARWTIEPKHAELAGCGVFSHIFSRSDGSALFVGAGRGRVRYGKHERQLVGHCILDEDYMPFSVMWMTVSADGTVNALSSFEGPGEFLLNSAAVDKDDALYLTGYLKGHVDLDPGPGRHWADGAENIETKGVLVKLDADGTLGFVREWPDTYLQGLAIGADGPNVTVLSTGTQIGPARLPKTAANARYVLEVSRAGELVRASTVTPRAEQVTVSGATCFRALPAEQTTVIWSK